MGRIITGLGWVVFLAGAGLVFVGLAGIALSDGVWAMMKILNPFNIANFVVTVATVAPGLLLIAWGQKLTEKRRLLNLPK